MSVQFVTSFSEEGYELCGKRMLETFTENVDAPIVVYYETETPPDFEHENVTYRSLSDVPAVMPILMAMKVFPAMQGIFRGKRHYTHDIYRFCRKIFAECDAAAQHEGILVWVDSDTVWEAPLSIDWVEDLFKERESDGLTPFCCVMRRPTWNICTSFVAWDLEHEQSLPFWQRYYDMLVSGGFLVMPSWDDTFLLQELLRGMELDVKDLAESYELEDGPVNVFDVVFEGVARHLKGNKKYEEQAA